MMRLETIAKDFAEHLRIANSEVQRKASLAACELALRNVPLDIPIEFESLEQLRQSGKLSQVRIAELNDLAARLDDRYFDLQDKAEDDESLQAEAHRLFSQARAVSALSFAGGEDALSAAMESIYEASMTQDDGSSFFAVVECYLSKNA